MMDAVLEHSTSRFDLGGGLGMKEGERGSELDHCRVVQWHVKQRAKLCTEWYEYEKYAIRATLTNSTVRVNRVFHVADFSFQLDLDSTIQFV